MGVVGWEVQRVQVFPREGSQVTPPHPSTSFKWKDYCPVAFAKLRKTFHIDPADYMLSICGQGPMLPCVKAHEGWSHVSSRTAWML